MSSFHVNSEFTYNADLTNDYVRETYRACAIVLQNPDKNT